MQTEGAWPLRRAYEAVLDALRARLRGRHPRRAVAYAARHRSAFMRPWEHEPHSIAHGILDDETYDWLAVVEEMLATGGDALVVDEATLAEANALALATTGDPGRRHRHRRPRRPARLRDAGPSRDDERVAVLFTGRDRSQHADGKESR